MKEKQISQEEIKKETNTKPLTGLFIFNTLLFFSLLPLTIFLIIYSVVTGSIIIVGTALLTNFVLTCITLLNSSSNLYKTISFIYLAVDIFIFIFGGLLLLFFTGIVGMCGLIPFK